MPKDQRLNPDNSVEHLESSDSLELQIQLHFMSLRKMAVAEADVHVLSGDEFVQGTSLWRDAWRRLLKNKLAVFGMIIVVLITVLSVVGPTLIKRTMGFTPDYIPTNDIRLVKSFPPFTGSDG